MRKLCSTLILLAVASSLSVAYTESVQYTYDEKGRLVQVDYESGERILYDYDGNGNLVASEIQTDGVVEYTLIYTAGEGGQIIGDSPQMVLHGSDGTPVKAEAFEGYHFVQWSDGRADNPRKDTNVTSDVNVEAQFAVTIPNPPLVSGPGSPTNNTRPTWTWTPGGGGVGRYRYSLDHAKEWTETVQTAFTPDEPLEDADYVFSVQEQDGAGHWSASGTHALTIDTAAPSVLITPVTPSPRMDPVETVLMTFTEPITGFTLVNLVLVRDSGGNLLTGVESLISSDGGSTWSLSGLAPLTAEPGGYVLLLLPEGITDYAGNPIEEGAQTAWTAAQIWPMAQVWVDFENGNDRHYGTWESPLKTLARAWEAVADGGTIYVLNDEVLETGLRIGEDGKRAYIVASSGVVRIGIHGR